MTDTGELGIADTLLLCLRHFGDAAQASILRYSQRRLRTLALSGLLECNKLAVNYSNGIKKLPTAFRLTETGADLVEHIRGIRPRRPAKSEISPITLMHRLAVVKTRVAIDDAHVALGLPKPPWIMEADQYEDREIKLADPAERRFILRESWGSGPSRISACPDASTLLTVPDETGEPRWLLAAYLEQDLSTEGSAVANKAAGYAKLLDSATNHYRRHWPHAHFARVLFVCPSQKRLENVARLIVELPGSENWRLAVNTALLPPPAALTEPVWHDVHGNAMPIFPVVPAPREPAP